jgi:hypothetical protein
MEGATGLVFNEPFALGAIAARYQGVLSKDGKRNG